MGRHSRGPPVIRAASPRATLTDKPAHANGGPPVSVSPVMSGSAQRTTGQEISCHLVRPIFSRSRRRRHAPPHLVNTHYSTHPLTVGPRSAGPARHCPEGMDPPVPRARGVSEREPCRSGLRPCGRGTASKQKHLSRKERRWLARASTSAAPPTPRTHTGARRHTHQRAGTRAQISRRGPSPRDSGRSGAVLVAGGFDSVAAAASVRLP